jgi:two-component system, OmpR family, sensor histidine kinase BaeS
MQSTFDTTTDSTLAAAVAPGGPRLVWAGAMLLATFATGVLFQARPGLNIPLVLLVTTGFAWHLEARRGGVHRSRSRAMEAIMLVIAGACAVSSDRALFGLIALSVLWLGSAAVLGSDLALSGLRLAGAPLVAIIRVLGRSGTEFESALRALRGGRYVAVLRGLAWALPTVALFFVLLAQADTTLEDWRTAMATMLQSLEFLPRLVFWTLCCVLLLGRLGLATHPARTAATAAAQSMPTPRADATERGIVLAGVDAVFGLFLLLQLPRLLTNSGARVGSGVTYAEAVHRGFGEITCVVSLAALLVCALDRYALRGRHENRIRLLTGVLLGESLLMLASAAARLLAYQEAYGYSVLRVYVQVYLGLAALGLMLLGREALGVVQPRRLVTRVAAAAFLAFAALSFVNVPAWVATHNIERRLEGRNLDVPYLTDSLGPDAVPAVEKQLPRLGAADRQGVLCTYGRSKYLQRLRTLPPDRWFEWNLRRRSAIAALQRMAAMTPACPTTAGVP